VQRNAMRSYEEQRDFKELLLADKDVTGVLDRPRSMRVRFSRCSCATWGTSSIESLRRPRRRPFTSAAGW
jgi:hypothetical protein